MASERAAQSSGRLKPRRSAGCRRSEQQEIEQDLQLYGSLLSDQQRMALQRELQQMQLQQNQSQFGASQAQSQDQFLRELAFREAGQNNAFDYGLGAARHLGDGDGMAINTRGGQDSRPRSRAAAVSRRSARSSARRGRASARCRSRRRTTAASSSAANSISSSC
jgi:hypothetical protein